MSVYDLFACWLCFDLISTIVNKLKTVEFINPDILLENQRLDLFSVKVSELKLKLISNLYFVRATIAARTSEIDAVIFTMKIAVAFEAQNETEDNC